MRSLQMLQDPAELRQPGIHKAAETSLIPDSSFMILIYGFEACSGRFWDGTNQTV